MRPMPGLSAGLSAAGSISRARQWTRATGSGQPCSQTRWPPARVRRPVVTSLLMPNLSMPVCAVKNSMRFKTQSILPYSMVLVRSRYTYFALLRSHLTLHSPSILHWSQTRKPQTTVLSRGSSGGYSCCTPVLLISRLLKYRLHHSSVAVRVSDEYRRGLPVACLVLPLS